MGSQVPKKEYPKMSDAFAYETLFDAWAYNNSNFPDTKEGWAKRDYYLGVIGSARKKYGNKQVNQAWKKYQKEEHPSPFTKLKNFITGKRGGGSVGYTQRWKNARKKNG